MNERPEEQKTSQHRIHSHCYLVLKDDSANLSGVKPGEEVVSSGSFKLRNGAAVQVNNDVRPSNNPAPRPEDN